ncbi:MAG: hypothetical protein C4344_07795 [Acidimicrobiia bacterium]
MSAFVEDDEGLGFRADGRGSLGADDTAVCDSGCECLLEALRQQFDGVEFKDFELGVGVQAEAWGGGGIDPWVMAEAF